MNPVHSPFAADPDLMRALSDLALPFPCNEDRVLFRQGEECFGIFLLNSGQAKLEMRSDDTGKIIARFATGSGSILGLPAAFSGEPYSLNAIAQEGADVGFVRRSRLLESLMADPLLSVKALQILAAETRAARAAMVEALARTRSSHRSRSNA